MVLLSFIYVNYTSRKPELLFDEGSPGNADWEGRKADFIGIGPVHQEWTVVDGGSFPPSHGDYSAVIETWQGAGGQGRYL